MQNSSFRNSAAGTPLSGKRQSSLIIDNDRRSTEVSPSPNKKSSRRTIVKKKSTKVDKENSDIFDVPKFYMPV